MNLCGKVAIITGGKRMAALVARELASSGGVDLVLSYRGSQGRSRGDRRRRR